MPKTHTPEIANAQEVTNVPETEKKAAKKTAGGSRKKAKNVGPHGIAHIKATFNNTIITITDSTGNPIVWGTAGEQFKGSRKSTPHAAQQTATTVGLKAKERGVKVLDVR